MVKIFDQNSNDGDDIRYPCYDDNIVYIFEEYYY